MRSILGIPAIYSLFTNLVGGRRSCHRFVKDHIHPNIGDKILDIGCGPGNFLEFLPEVDYVGFDASPSYIEAAQRRFGNRGRFFCELVTRNTLQGENFDLVLSNGVLHHLNDEEASQLFELAYSVLKPGGRLVTEDGCYVPGQSAIARYLLRLDRGRFVRDKEGYENLAKLHFTDTKTTIRHDLLRIPYTHIIMECTK